MHVPSKCCKQYFMHQSLRGNQAIPLPWSYLSLKTNKNTHKKNRKNIIFILIQTRKQNKKRKKTSEKKIWKFSKMFIKNKKTIHLNHNVQTVCIGYHIATAEYMYYVISSFLTNITCISNKKNKIINHLRFDDILWCNYWWCKDKSNSKILIVLL